MKSWLANDWLRSRHVMHRRVTRATKRRGASTLLGRVVCTEGMTAVMWWGFNLCGSTRDVDEDPEEVERPESAPEPATAGPSAEEHDEMAKMMEFYSQASALYSQARLVVDMLEDQKAAGIEVDEVKLQQAKAAMAETRKALNSVGMRS